MGRERVIEIFLGGIFIILLIIMIFSFTSISASGSKSQTTTISNSYNTYNIETTQPRYVSDSYSYYKKTPTKYYKTTKPYYYNDRDYLKYDYRPYKDYQYPRYKYEYSKGIFGNEINEYKIYLQNKENKAGYYSVKFYLKDYSGDVRVETVTHYLKPYEEKIFRYKNVFDDEYDYAWNYVVKSPNY